MLTQTTVTAVRILVHLATETPGEVASLKTVANALDHSPTYLVKIARHLVRVGILRAQRGKTGGVVFNKAPKDVTLLSIVEACQGTVQGNFCQEVGDLSKTCAMHRAGAELQQAILAVLSKWTLADFVGRPKPARELQGRVSCLMQGGRPGVILPARRGGR